MSKKITGLKKSSLTPELAKKILEQKFEKIKTNAYLIVFSLLFIVIILFFYYNSKGYKENNTLVNMVNYKLYIITGSDLVKNSDKRLCDFYISSAYKPYMVDKQLFGYCSLKIMKSILLAGVRCVYIDIFNSSMSSDADPVINNGYMEGEWKLALNNINFKDMCMLIKKVVFSSGNVNNSNDPFILCLNLKTNGNYKCLNKVKKILFDVFGSRLLDNTYTYSIRNVITEPIKNFMGKIIIFSSSGYENSDLEEFINYSWDRSGLHGLKKITYESLDEESQNANVVKLDNNDLKTYNKSGMTLVTPNENSIFTYNYDPNYGWDSGSQLVFLNFQRIDNNMTKYIEKFQTKSFVIKPGNMLYSSENENQEDPDFVINKEEKKNKDIIEDPSSCPEKPDENYDYLLGDDMLFYKNKGDKGLGLCYGIENDKNCNCNTEDSNCDPTLWSEHTITNTQAGAQAALQVGAQAALQAGEPADSNSFKLCCSTTRINDPSIRYSKITKSDDDSTPKFTTDPKYFYSSEQSFNLLEEGSTPKEYNKCKIETHDDLKGNVCLLNINPKTLKCPDGWTYKDELNNKKYDGLRMNICCKNL